jgi:hypothetical protein
VSRVEEEQLTPFVGIDIGQKRDPTSIAVVEAGYRNVEDPGRVKDYESHFQVRYLDRLPLGTPYPEVARRLGDVCRKVQERKKVRPQVFVDATGVGQPILDLLRDHTRDAWIIWGVYFTHGDRRIADREAKMVTLGKAHLVSRLQTLFQTGRIHVPSIGEARTLAQELENYEIRVDENANDRYGAFKVGTHDDLVTALGLAVQIEPRLAFERQPGPPGKRRGCVARALEKRRGRGPLPGSGAWALQNRGIRPW